MIRLSGRAPTLPKKRTARAEQRRRKNATLYKHVVKLANNAEISIAPATSIHEAMELVFRRTLALWKFAASNADALNSSAPDGHKDALWYPIWDAQGNRLLRPNKWIEYEATLREELWEQGTDLMGLNIDERRVRVEEAQMEILGRALSQAARDTGLTDTQQKQLGAALRTRLQELAPPPAASEVVEADAA